MSSYSERKRNYILERREKSKEVQDRHKVSAWGHVIEMLVTRKYTLNCAICVFGLLDKKIKSIPYLDTNAMISKHWCLAPLMPRIFETLLTGSEL